MQFEKMCCKFNTVALIFIHLQYPKHQLLRHIRQKFTIRISTLFITRSSLTFSGSAQAKLLRFDKKGNKFYTRLIYNVIYRNR